MDTSGDYDDDGNNIVPCPLCGNIGCNESHEDWFDDIDEDAA